MNFLLFLFLLLFFLKWQRRLRGHNAPSAFPHNLPCIAKPPNTGEDLPCSCYMSVAKHTHTPTPWAELVKCWGGDTPVTLSCDVRGSQVTVVATVTWRLLWCVAHELNWLHEVHDGIVFLYGYYYYFFSSLNYLFPKQGTRMLRKDQTHKSWNFFSLQKIMIITFILYARSTVDFIRSVHL